MNVTAGEEGNRCAGEPLNVKSRIRNRLSVQGILWMC